jgi:DNA modification methylase
MAPNNGNGLSYEDDEILEEAESLGYSVPDVPDEVVNIGGADGENWRDFPEIATNSLWIIGSRSREGMHEGKYHGNFVPQIPFQAIRRFTEPEDVVLDVFLGSGTTLIECRRQGRHGIGIELIESIAEDAVKRIESESNPYNTWQQVITGDSTSEDVIGQVREELAKRGRSQVQLMIMHPPYHDIIQFSEDPRDLCNAPTLKQFLESLQKVVRVTYDFLEKNHFLVVVIGDKYGNREWVPLGFYTVEAVKSMGYTLKSIVVKNMEGNRAKRNLENLWRQRAFKGKYYIFKHEYILFFQKTGMAESLWKITEFIREIDDREELNRIGDRSFVSGDELKDLIKWYPWVTPSRFLALKQGAHLRAVALDLSGVSITRDVEGELEDLISRLPDRDKIVDVSVLAESEERARLKNIPGVSQVYPPDEQSLEQLAHAVYVVTKATGSGQRAGRAAGVAFAEL